MSLCARVCSCGCGQPLLKADGTPDWSRRRFASRECLAKDKCNRVASKRLRAERHPGPRLVVDGVEFVGININAWAKQLRNLGHDVKILREQRKKKAKAANA
jgi:hypothetical protein